MPEQQAEDQNSDQATQPEQAPAPESAPPEKKLDWRIFVIVGVVVLFLVAVIINRTKWSNKNESEAGAAKEPAQKTAKQEPAKPISREERYALAVKNCELDARGAMFTADERLFLMARLPSPVRKDTDSKLIQDINPGAMFDVTQRLDQVKPEMLHRRGAVYMDAFVPLGVDPKLEMLFTPAADVGQKSVADDDAVIGVKINGEARAYPVRLISFHEVINDMVGNTPIVIAWSALGVTASAMERSLDDGSTPLFRSAGLIYQEAAVLTDVNTLSLWSPVQRTCLAGRLCGKSLKPVQADVVAWKIWKGMNPETTLLTGTKPTINVDYSKILAATGNYLRTPSFHPIYGYDIFKTAVGLKMWVVGVTSPDGKAFKAYEEGLLSETKGAVDDAIGGQKVVVEYNPETTILSAKDSEGRQLLTEKMLWVAWVGSHNNTEIWQEEKLRAALEAAANPQAVQAPDTNAQIAPAAKKDQAVPETE